MATPSRTLLTVVVACAALTTAPAWAAGGDSSPGALKKDTTTQTATAPVSAPAPQAPAQSSPKTQGGSKDTTNTTSNTNAKTPVTKGTVKKLTPAAPTTTSGSAPAAQGTTTTSRTRTSARRATSGRRSSTRTGSTTRRSEARARHRTGNPATGRAGAASKAAGTKPDAGSSSRSSSAAAPRTHKARHAAKAAHAHSAKTADKPATRLATINRAADRVIEVIPGALLLALVGLAALVLVLVVRSWMMERRRMRALADSYGITVQALATAIEAKDHTTGGHIERVRGLGLLLARELVPREARDPQMAYGFLLHDIGKLAVPDAILRAPGRLTDDEWSLMRRHPEEGVRILRSIPFLDRALDVVLHHHERWDGGGYPHGLAGEDIPLWARIFAVADALDAMTAERPYRPRQPYSSALEEIRRHAGTQFDPQVVAALERIEPAEVERLLEPAQVLDRTRPSPEPGELEPLEAILAATEAARVQAGDVSPLYPETVA